MRDEEVPVVLMDLPTTVRGFVTLGEDNLPCIFINARMSKEQQQKTWRHEMNHIERGELFDDDYDEYGGSTWVG